MATIKSFTDIQQSHKLAEILPIESADMWYDNNGESIAGKPEVRYCSFVGLASINVPCWSLAALLSILPSEFTEKGKYSETTYKIDIRKYALTDDVDLYQIAYGNYKFYEDGNHSWNDMVNTGEKENLLDAAFEMICWLGKNNKL